MNNILNTLIKIFLIISISIFLIVLASFIYFDNNQQPVPDTNQSLEVNSSLVQDLYNLVNPNHSISWILYSKEKITNEYIITVSISKYIKSLKTPPETIPQTTVEKFIQDIFGSNISYQHQNAWIFVPNVCNYSYDKDKSIYKAVNDCGAMEANWFSHKATSAELNNDTLKIYDKAIYVSDEGGVNYTPNSLVYIYSNYDQKTLIDQFERGSSNVPLDIDIDVDKYLDKASTYVYTFKKQGDNYIFDSFTRN